MLHVPRARWASALAADRLRTLAPGLARAKLTTLAARADTPIRSPCPCQPGD